MKLEPINSDTYLCKEVTEGFKVINGLKRREREGTPEYVNFSNLVEVLSVKKDNNYGIKVGDTLMVTHFVADQKLDKYLVVYDEDIFAKLEYGEHILEIENYDAKTFNSVICYPYKKKNKSDTGLEWTSDESTRLARTVLDNNVIVEYNKNADYEVFVNGVKYFVIDLNKAYTVNFELQNSYVKWNDTMISRKGDVKDSALVIGEKYIKKADILCRILNKSK